jgi:predicted tellurium resistance membrane protein TerC
MVKQLWVMVVAVLISTAVMMWSAGAVSAMIDRHPTLKMLALAFLVLIGANLLAEGFHQHIPKGYTYFAMAFSMGVEMLNMKLRARRQPSTQPPTPI